MLDSKALTKIQTLAIVAGVIIAAVSGSITYVVLNKQENPATDIKIGVCADLDKRVRQRGLASSHFGF